MLKNLQVIDDITSLAPIVANMGFETHIGYTTHEFPKHDAMHCKA
jgi:hypothetical protein